ncbi:VWA domain-containing protein, partial [Aromatoleum toluvorans]
MNPADNLAIGFAGFTLLRPWWLLALLPAWALLGRLSRTPPSPFGNWTGVVDAALLPHLVEPARPTRTGTVRALIAAGLTLAILALSGPALQGRTHVALRSDAMRVLVADLSPASEHAPGGSLVEALQIKLLDLLARMPDGQTALIAYAGEPYLVAPPTTDTATLRLLVAELTPDVLPVAGNRPERALQMAAKLLAHNDTTTRDVLWLSATDDATAPTLQAVADLHAARVRVSRLRLADSGSDNPTAALHDAVLASGGLDLARRTDDRDVSTLLAHLEAAMPLRQEQVPTTATPRDLGPWLLALLLPFAALAFRRGVVAMFVAVLLLPPPAAQAGDFADWWQRPDQRAMQALQDGAAEAAAARFADARWKAVAYYRAGKYADAAALLEPFGDADTLYNRGNALARLQRLDDALQAYEAALQRRPDDPDILHNRELVRELMQRPPPPET